MSNDNFFFGGGGGVFRIFPTNREQLTFLGFRQFSVVGFRPKQMFVPVYLAYVAELICITAVYNRHLVNPLTLIK